MNKYRLGTGLLCSAGSEDERKFCVLGVYMVEKHGWNPDALARSSFPAYEEMRKHPDDLLAMAKVLWEDPSAPYKDYLEGIGEEDSYGEVREIEPPDVYNANDDGAPVELLEKALKAVGVEVSLEDTRRAVERWKKKEEANA